jgi:hypothetical protein
VFTFCPFHCPDGAAKHNDNVRFDLIRNWSRHAFHSVRGKHHFYPTGLLCFLFVRTMKFTSPCHRQTTSFCPRCFGSRLRSVFASIRASVERLLLLARRDSFYFAALFYPQDQIVCVDYEQDSRMRPVVAKSHVFPASLESSSQMTKTIASLLYYISFANFPTRYAMSKSPQQEGYSENGCPVAFRKKRVSRNQVPTYFYRRLR